MTADQSQGAPDAVTYHYIITVTWPGEGTPMATCHGTVHVGPGATREDAYRRVFDEVRRRFPVVPENSNTLYFDLAPNDMSAANRKGGAS